MSSNKAKYQENDRTLHFDFDEWLELHRRDPEAFEARRLEWSQNLIDNAPQAYQRRLSGLLFQINMHKQRSANAMDSCIRLSGLMWDKLHELREELQRFVALPVQELQPAIPSSQPPSQRSADVVPLVRASLTGEALAKNS